MQSMELGVANENHIMIHIIAHRVTPETQIIIMMERLIYCINF